eukprot:5168038-Prymnesium_polylepis.1
MMSKKRNMMPRPAGSGCSIEHGAARVCASYIKEGGLGLSTAQNEPRTLGGYGSSEAVRMTRGARERFRLTRSTQGEIIAAVATEGRVETTSGDLVEE